MRILFLFCITLLALPVALRAEEVGVRITIRRGPNADSLNQLQAQITSGSLRGGQVEYVEVMRVAYDRSSGVKSRISSGIVEVRDPV